MLMSGLEKTVPSRTDLVAPISIVTDHYSGKFIVRVPPETHRALAIRAAEQGVSMNRLVSVRLAKDH